MKRQQEHRLGSVVLGALLLVLGGVIGGAIVARYPAMQGKSIAGAAVHAASRPARASGSTAAATPAIDLLRESAIDKVLPAVVEVINVGNGLGSGSIIDHRGYIVTNNHVVAGATHLQVTLGNGSTVPAKLVGADPVDDLAVVQIHVRGLPIAEFGNSSDLQIGQSVLAIGNPLGIVQTVTDGIVSALHRQISEGSNTPGSILNAVQTSAAINPGNSGGVLINLSGEVIGVPTLAAVDPEFNAPAAGVGFAIPANTVRTIATQIITYGRVIHSGRAYLGIGAEEVSPDVAAQYNLPIDHGVLIGQVSPGGPAQKAGLRAGDIIVKVGSTPIATYDDLLTALAALKPGEAVTVTVVTPQGKTQTVRVTLAERPITANG